MSLSQAEKAAAMHAKAEVEQLRKMVTETAAVAHTDNNNQEEPAWFKEQDAAVDARQTQAVGRPPSQPGSKGLDPTDVPDVVSHVVRCSVCGGTAKAAATHRERSTDETECKAWSSRA